MSTTSTSTSSSTQTQFIQRSDAAIAEAAQLVQADTQDLKKLFHQVYALFAKRRHQIAQDAGDPNAPLFGADRVLRPTGGIANVTPLGGERYKAYGVKLAGYLHAALAEPPIQTTVLGRRSEFSVEVLTESERVKREWDTPISEAEMQKVFQVSSTEALQMVRRYLPFISLNEAIYRGDPKGVEIFYKKHPDLFKREFMALTMNAIVEGYLTDAQKKHLNEGLQKQYVVGEKRFEVKGKMIPVARFLAVIVGEEVCRRSLDEASIFVVHQDTPLIRETLEDIASIFERVMSWSEEEASPNDLKNLMGLFHYEFANAMPSDRGSAAIGEWFLSLFCKHHGIQVRIDADKKIDLEALTQLSFGDFLEVYRDMVHIEKA